MITSSAWNRCLREPSKNDNIANGTNPSPRYSDVNRSFYKFFRCFRYEKMSARKIRMFNNCIMNHAKPSPIWKIDVQSGEIG